MVEAAGVESSRNFAVVRGHANSNQNMHTRIFQLGTTMHDREGFFPRPVLSKARGGGGGRFGGGRANGLTHFGPRKFIAKGPVQANLRWALE